MLSQAVLLSFLNHDRCEWLVRDFQTLTAREIDELALDVVVHLASFISIDESMVRPMDYLKNNEMGGLTFIQRLVTSETKPFLILGSSAEVYGQPQYTPMDTRHPTVPLNFYAVTKLALENYWRVAQAWYGYPVIIVRNFNTYGPNQLIGPFAPVIPSFIVRALEGEPLIVHNSGHQTRDFLFVEDAVRAYELIIAQRDELVGRIFNLGSGVETTIENLAYLIRSIVDSPLEIQFKPGRFADIRCLLADISALRESVGWLPETSLVDGLICTVEWYRQALAQKYGGNGQVVYDGHVRQFHRERGA
jgi:nucleoside-diphosphate-sugar epimerase